MINLINRFMDIKKITQNVMNFGINRFLEIFGICVVIIAILLLISLISFSPDDPNFIFPDSTEIKNLLGYHGSFSADLFFQSFGLIALLTGIKAVKECCSMPVQEVMIATNILCLKYNKMAD